MRSVIICLAISLALVGSVWADILFIAQSEIGKGEIGGNNTGKEVILYLNGQNNLPWCAGFVSYCIRKTGKKFPYLLRAKSFVKYGEVITKTELKSGDLAVFTRQGGGHVGIIESISKEGFVCIEGNVGDYPSKIKRVSHKFTDKNIYKFVRI